jgi:hypothetical protein
MTVLKKIDTIILHVPKTGGSSVRWPAIKKYNIRFACQHCNYEYLPEKYKNFRKVTFVRNPLDWYKSRYFFDKMRFNNKRNRDMMTIALSHEFKKSLNETLDLYLNLDKAFEDKRTLFLYKKLLKLNVLNKYTCWNISYHDDIEEIKPGYFKGKTYYQWQLDTVGINEADAHYRIEDQYEYGMQKEFGMDIDLIHKNKTPRRLFREDYTDETKNKILHFEQNFIKKYGY